VSEAYNTFVVNGPIVRGPLQYAAIWKTAQKMSERPVKFGTISAACVTAVVKNRHYRDEHERILELAAIQNEELKEVAEAGCPVIQIRLPGRLM
jgi:5-methyltetrahydropteroyltriglutamate--homocysteine methyltransferase